MKSRFTSYTALVSVIAWSRSNHHTHHGVRARQLGLLTVLRLEDGAGSQGQSASSRNDDSNLTTLTGCSGAVADNSAACFALCAQRRSIPWLLNGARRNLLRRQDMNACRKLFSMGSVKEEASSTYVAHCAGALPSLHCVGARLGILAAAPGDLRVRSVERARIPTSGSLYVLHPRATSLWPW